MSAMVGTEAPDFSADALDQGQTREVSLADYRGRWVMLFFYPADFSTV
jgi:peroxiredoxin (alkyl hydroperoxide reductase subunit C)